MVIQDIELAKKINGEKGLGEGVFYEDDGPPLSDYVEDVFNSVKAAGVTGRRQKPYWIFPGMSIMGHLACSLMDIEGTGRRSGSYLRNWLNVGRRPPACCSERAGIY